jgi:hypothetical protein
VIDVLILTKDEDGSVEATELSDVGDLGELREIESELAEIVGRPTTSRTLGPRASEHPQRGSNPCRRLERVPEQGRLPGI